MFRVSFYLSFFYFQNPFTQWEFFNIIPIINIINNIFCTRPYPWIWCQHQSNKIKNFR